MRQTKIGVLATLMLAASALHPQASDPNIAKLKSAAEAGDAASQVMLGLAYQNGSGVDSNDAEAVRWYRKAAEVGNPEGQNDLGVMYMNGWGVEKNKQEAVHWYRLAAKQRNAHSMFNLGAAYYNGDGIGIDDIKAYAWFLLAQENGSTAAADAVQRAERDLRPGSSGLAASEIASMYFKGVDLNRDTTEGVKWLRKPAQAGDVRAQLALAGVLLDGVDLPPNYEEGRQWCEVALKQKAPLAAYCLGDIYRKGLGVPKDPGRALPLLRQAANSGVTPAMKAAAELLAAREMDKAQRQEALTYFIRVILAGDNSAIPEAAKVRSQMSDQEWKRWQKEIRGHVLVGDHDKLEAALGSIQTGSRPN